MDLPTNYWNSFYAMIQKFGCAVYPIDRCILVRSPIEDVSTVIREYFGLEVRSNCRFRDFIEIEKPYRDEFDRQRRILTLLEMLELLLDLPWPVPLWQLENSEWTIISPSSYRDDSLAFPFALLLESEAIDFYGVSYTDFKLFKKDRLIEQYIFGSTEDLVFLSPMYRDYWDAVVEFFGELHYFKSSIRSVRRSQIEVELSQGWQAVDENTGFLNRCFQERKAYLPSFAETPYGLLLQSQAEIDRWESTVKRLDIVMAANWPRSGASAPDRIET